MKLPKKQIIYGLVLAAAGAAYAIDAAFFGPPSPAHGTPLSPEGTPGGSVKESAGGGVGAADAPEHLLTTRLQKWAANHPSSLSEMPDVFQAPAIAKPILIAAPLPVLEDPSVLFSRKHRLIAIVLNGDGGYALVDGRVLRVGQSIDGALLIGLTRREARFTSADRTFDMPLTADVHADR